MPFIEARFIDIYREQIYPARISWEQGKIVSVERIGQDVTGFILPGFIDAHIHIESSMLVPSEFARLAVLHGTVATVSDPHEIANVLGMDGVHYMIDNARQVPFHFFFGAPSCVPATAFETAGAEIGADDIRSLMEMKEILYLSEMMNFPGVIHRDPMVMQKIAYAHAAGKPVDGHAPGLRGEALRKYLEAGISTDHECFTYEEALEKIQAGMKVIIREGSAAKNFEALIPLLADFPEQLMLCSDDKHPDDLLLGHINQLVKRALQKGFDLFKVLRAACINPVQHYKLPVGTLREGEAADFILLNNLEEWVPSATYIQGELVASEGRSLIEKQPVLQLNHFSATPVQASDFRVEAKSPDVKVIEALDGQLITRSIEAKLPVKNGMLEADISQDILKIAVVNRYKPAMPAVAFIRNFGLKHGAIASCVAHDCHNIVAVGTSDEELAAAVNLIISSRGGISVVNGLEQEVLALPVAGIMSDQEGAEVAAAYSSIDRKARALGTALRAPYMTLSFMALLVIPQLKLSDLGLFDGEHFTFTSLFRDHE